jgi:hypothetical protein
LYIFNHSRVEILIYVDGKYEFIAKNTKWKLREIKTLRDYFFIFFKNEIIIWYQGESISHDVLIVKFPLKIHDYYPHISEFWYLL